MIIPFLSSKFSFICLPNSHFKPKPCTLTIVMSSLSRLRRIFTINPSKESLSSIKPSPKKAHDQGTLFLVPAKSSRGRNSPIDPFGEAKPHIPKSVHADIHDLKSTNSFEEIVDKFKRCCERNDFRRNLNIYSHTVRRLTEAQKFSMVEDILEYQKKYQDMTNEGFVVRLISLYGKAGMFDHAQALFNEMPHFNCQRTIRSFCALLSAGVNAKKFHKVEELFRQLPSKLSIDAESRSYSIVVRAYCEMGYLDSARSMLDEMEKNGIEPTLITFNTLLEGFYKNNMYVEGEKIWTLMQSRGFAPDVWSCRSRLLGMVFSNQTSEAAKLIEEMKLKSFNPDVDFFNVLIKGFRFEGKVEEAKNWYEELLKRKCIPDESTYMTLIPFLCEKDNFDMAAQLCSVALRDKPLINASILKCVVDGLHSKGMIEEARKLVDLGKRKKLEIDLPLDLK